MSDMKDLNKQTFKRAAWVSVFYVIALFVCFLCFCKTKFFYVQNILILSGIFVSAVWIVLMIIIAKLHSAAYEYYIINPPEQNQNSNQDNNQEDTKKEGKK